MPMIGQQTDRFGHEIPAGTAIIFINADGSVITQSGTFFFSDGTITATYEDVVTFLYDGTNYFGVSIEE